MKILVPSNWRRTTTVVVIVLISIVNAEPPVYGNTNVATNTNTKGVRYAGPIVYTNEKPPIITFPSPPPTHGGYSGGHSGKGSSVKYIPMPAHDLPVLIYQSNISPPLHVVGVAPSPLSAPSLEAGSKKSYGSHFEDTYGAGSDIVKSTSYEIPSVPSTASSYGIHPSVPSSTYGSQQYGSSHSYAAPKDSYTQPTSSYEVQSKDSYGSSSSYTAQSSYGFPQPTSSYGPPKGSSSYGPPKSSSSYGPPKSSSSYGPPKTSSSYGPPKSSSSYGPPKTSSSYGPPKSSSSYGPPKSSSSYGPPKSSSSYGPPKFSSYGPPKSSSSYGPPKSSSYGPPKSSYGPKSSSSSTKSHYKSPKSSYGRQKSSYSSSSSTKSNYRPQRPKYMKGEYSHQAPNFEYIPYKTKSPKGTAPHIIYTGHPPIHIFQTSPLAMYPPKPQAGYGPPPKEDQGWVSTSTKSKSIYDKGGSGTLEDSWSNGSETYVTTVPFTGNSKSSSSSSSSAGKKEKGSKSKGHRVHSYSSGESKESSKTKSGPGKEARKKSQNLSHNSYKTQHSKGPSNIFSEMWRTVVDSALAGSSHIANAYGYGQSHSAPPPPPPSPRKPKKNKGHKSGKYLPANMSKPPIIIYVGQNPPQHVFEQSVNPYESFTSYSSPDYGYNRRNDNIDPRNRGDTDALASAISMSQQTSIPVPLWLPNTNVPLANDNFQTSLYVSDLTSAGGNTQSIQQQQQQPVVLTSGQGVQTQVTQHFAEAKSSQVTSESQQVPLNIAASSSPDFSPIQGLQYGQPIPASEVSMMFKLA